MRWSKAFIPTLREDPAEAEVPSHRLLLRAGYIRQTASGIYSLLYLAQRSMLKIARIIREEMNSIGAQEFYLPALNPAELWQESGRYDEMGDTMFRLKDRNGRPLCLALTHEEGMTDIARRELRSYRQLPQIWYQIQEKFRDEPRPKSGLLRMRQFMMKDSYSFDIDPKAMAESYRKHYDAYCRIFERCGLRYKVVEALSGAMGGSGSQEFMVVSDAGEDVIVHCDCGYAANQEKATARATPVQDDETEHTPEEFPTPGQRTIHDLVKFTGEAATKFIKTLVYAVEDKPLILLLRGDHQLSEVKLGALLGTDVFRPARDEEALKWMGASVGYLGPVGVSDIRVVADETLKGRQNMVTGANKEDTHLRYVTPDKNVKAEYKDLREIGEGDLCGKCGKPLNLPKAIEIGHVFQLGRRYSEAMGATVLDPEGKSVTVWMGSYGIGLERILTASIEQNVDADGTVLPVSIAPFEVILTVANSDNPKLREAGDRMYEEMRARRIDVLYDDRDERPGVKFKDADLTGIPWRVTLGRKKFELGLSEIRDRSTGKTTDVRIADMVDALATREKGGT